MKKTVLGVLVTSILLTGCQSPNEFAPLPSKPSSITITKYLDSKPDKKTSYVLTGKRMETLYTAIQEEAKNVIKPGEVYNCPTYASGTPIWDYSIFIHYPNHSDRSFTQTDSTGCVELRDNQTGATAMGYLPALSPFG